MNERIKELAEQSNLRAALLLKYWGKIDALTDSEQDELENIEKFAKLVVKDCCQAFWSEECNVSDLAYEEYYRNAKRIKQHFGVEE